MSLQPTISHEAKVLEITAAAMQATMQGKAHVFVSYSGHVNMLSVYAHTTASKYSSPAKTEMIFSEYALLEFPSAGAQLDKILKLINEL